MLTPGPVVFGARDVSRAVGFWAAALGLSASEPSGDNHFTKLHGQDGRTVLSIQASEQAADAEPRLHLDLCALDRGDQLAEVERLIGLGARRVDWRHYPPDADFIVLADTEDNLFCVVDHPS